MLDGVSLRENRSGTTTSSTTLAGWHPGWTGVALGTAGVAVAALEDPLAGSDVDLLIGAALALIATVTTAVLVTLLLVRVVRHRHHAGVDLADPRIGAMYGTAPAALIVVALSWAQLAVGGRLPASTAWAVLALLVVGAASALVIGIEFFHRVVHNDAVPVPALSGAWFVPIVVFVLVPSVGVRLLLLQPQWATTTALALMAASWGAGMLLFLLLAPILGWRLVTGPAPVAHQAPSWWIWLAPAGAGGLGAIALSRSAALVVGTEPVAGVVPVLGLLAGTALWGFGAWWAALAGRAVIASRAAAGGLPFHVGSWGFVFPTAAMTVLTIVLGRSWEAPSLAGLGVALWLATLLLWVALAWKTLRGLRDRSLLGR
jgi:tellurite resistance protein TehA-like permease